ncbi:MAG: hypothetical protein Q9227_004035 [Pyrenula ochraceoflavens]
MHPGNFRTNSLLGLVLAIETTRTFAAPTNNTGVSFVVQPKRGGGPNEDCGNGPITFDTNTWNSHNMDSLVNDFYNNGLKNEKTGFDFHQEFAEKYGSDLFCRLASENCEDGAGVCSQLKGSTQEKEQGLLGLNAIQNAQSIFVSFDKAIDAAANNLIGKLDDFTTVSDSVRRFKSMSADRIKQFLEEQNNNGIFSSLFEGLLGLGSTALGALGPEGEVAGSLIELGGGVASSFLFPDPDPLKDFSKALDMWGKVQNGLHSALNQTHSALFSNGDTGDGNVQGPDKALPDWMKGGNMINPVDYTQSYANMEDTMTKLLAIRLLQSIAQGQNGFVVFIENVVKDCPKWKTNSRDRYCGFSDGMYFLVGLDPNHNVIELKGFDKVDQWGGFNIQRDGLLHSVGWEYESNGLGYTPTANDFKNILDRDRRGDDIASQIGAFSLPVCRIQAANWKQSDNMGPDSPPCDCKTVADKNGKKFYDVAPDEVKKWLDTKC